MPSNFMVDLETLGTAPGSVVLSIGAVAFDAEEGAHPRTFYSPINLEDSLRLGLRIDASTLRWWSKQDRTAYQDALASGAPPLASVLQQFGWWLELFDAPRGQRKVWGNGADFDVTLLLALYRAVGVEAPWDFWNHRCYRTLKALRTDVRPEKTNNHNALDDARNQAEHAVALLRALRG